MSIYSVDHFQDARARKPQSLPCDTTSSSWVVASWASKKDVSKDRLYI